MSIRISMTTRTETGVREMCNLSEGVYERAEAKADAEFEARLKELMKTLERVLAEENAQALKGERKRPGKCTEI